MFRKKSLEHILELMKDDRKIIENKDITELDTNVVNEGMSNKIRDIKEIERLLKGLSSPVIENGNSSGFNLILCLVGDNDEGLTILLEEIRSRGDDLLAYVYINDGIDEDLLKRNKSYDIDAYKKIEEIVEKCDYDFLFNLHKKLALDFIKKRIGVYANFFESIVSIKDMSISTLGVTYNKRIKNFVLYYNPKFPLLAAIQEYLYGGFESLLDSYIYTLAFLLSHEISHILRNHTMMGEKMIEDVTHKISNLIEDNFINMFLARVLEGPYTEGKRRLLTSGVGGEIYISSVSSAGADTILNSGFKKYEDIDSLVNAILTEISKILKMGGYIDVTYYSGSRYTDISNYEGKDFILKIISADLSLFNDNSVLYTNTMNKIIKCISDGKPKELPKDDKGKSGKGAEGPEISNIKGKIVKEKSSGKYGVVIEDNDGNLKVAFPKNQDEVKLRLGINESFVGQNNPIADLINNGNTEIKDLTYKDVVLIELNNTSGMSGGSGESPKYPEDLEVENLDKNDDNGSSGGSGSGGEQGSDDEVGSDDNDGSGNDSGSEEGSDDSSGEGSGDGSREENSSDTNPISGEDLGLERDDERDGEDSPGDGESDNSDGSGSSGNGSDGDDNSGGENDNEDREAGNTRTNRLKEILDGIAEDKNILQERIKEEDKEKLSGTFKNDGDNDDSMDKLSTKKDEAKKLKDILDKAMKNVLNKNKNVEDDKVAIEAENMLKEMGLNKITSLFKPKNVSDWKARINKILQQALGVKDVWDMEAINKRIEDAPPGYEVEEKEIENIVIMLDCSASMGADKFRDAIQHLTSMFAAYRMKHVKFHLIPWGGNLSEIEKEYKRIRGDKKVKETLMVMTARWGYTDIIAPFILCANKVKRPDLILVLTDGYYNSWSYDNPTVRRYIMRNKNRIYWLFTKDHTKEETLKLDPMAKSQDRMVVLGK